MSVFKRFKPSSMNIEQLPNELFIEIFSYLTNVDVIYGFSLLNNRFQQLTRSVCKILDFKSVDKTKFDWVIQQHSPEYWGSLRLSTDDETPGQIEYFSQFYPFDQYVSQLKSVTLIGVQPNHDYKLFSQLQSLTNLSSLTIQSICGLDFSALNLPLLKHLVITSCINSNSIINFSHLESLQYIIEQHQHPILLKDNEITSLPSTLKHLQIHFDEEKHGQHIRNLISSLTNLITLKICVEHKFPSLPNGQVWEKLIRSFLLSLKKFDFYFTFNLPLNINDIIASFSTRFYLYEKRWFIRCDYHRKTGAACLYSLPCILKSFSIRTYSFETCRTTFVLNLKCTYKHARTLILNYNWAERHSTFRPHQINHLILNTSFLSHTWLPILTHLRHLSIGFGIQMNADSVRQLLEYTANLYHLTIQIDSLIFLTDEWKNQIICNLLSSKIQRLDLNPQNQSFSNPITSKDLQHIVRIFGVNCKHLTIYLESYQLIETFILPNMTNLRSLNVSGVFKRASRTFVMNSVEQWKRSNHITASYHGFQIWS